MTTASDRPESGPVKLGGFSKESTKVIRQLEEYGWTFTVSRQGHAIGHAPDGVTRTSISKNLSRANRSQQAAEATVKRWERALAERKAVDEIDKAEVTMNAEQDHPYDPVLTPLLLAATQKHVNESGTAFGEAILAEVASAPEPRATDIDPALVCDLCGYVGKTTKGLNQHKGHTHKRKAAEPSPALVEEALEHAEALVAVSDSDRVLEAIRTLLGGITQDERAAYEARIETLRRDLETAEERERILQENLDAWLSLAPRPE